MEFNTPELPAMGWVEPLREEDRQLLGSYGNFQALYPGKDLVVQGKRQTHLYMIISGKLEVRREALEEDVVVGLLHPGECVGEVCVFDPGVASATVRALEFSQIWGIDAVSLGDFMDANPEAGKTLMIGLATILSQRLRDATHKLAAATEKHR